MRAVCLLPSSHPPLIVCLWKKHFFSSSSKNWKAPPPRQYFLVATYLWFISVPLDGCWFSWSSWSGWSPSSVCFFRAWAIIEATLSLSTCHTDKNAIKPYQSPLCPQSTNIRSQNSLRPFNFALLHFKRRWYSPKKSGNSAAWNVARVGSPILNIIF